MKRPVRIKDIAARAEVSTGTVDRVIHGRGNVSKPVAERIRQVMNELDYKPNRIASTLAYNRTYRIATLLPDYRTDPYWEQPHRGLERAFEGLQHYNFAWEPFYFHLHLPSEFREQAARILQGRPDALLLAPVFLQEGLWLMEECRRLGIPTVKINSNIDEASSLCYVGQDSYQSGVLAGKLLHFFLEPAQSVMVLNLDREANSAQHLIDKERGLRDYFARTAGHPVEVVQCEFAGYDDPRQLAAFMEERFSALPRLKGIFVTNSRAYKLLDCFGGRLPSDIRIVGFDLLPPNLRYLQENKISFLINQNPTRQGYQGIINLYTHLVAREAVQRTQYLPLDIVVTENAEYYLQREQELKLVL